MWGYTNVDNSACVTGLPAVLCVQCAAAAGRERVLLLLLNLCNEEAGAAAAGGSLLHLLSECGGNTPSIGAALSAAVLRQQVDTKAMRPGLDGWTALVGTSQRAQ